MVCRRPWRLDPAALAWQPPRTADAGPDIGPDAAPEDAARAFSPMNDLAVDIFGSLLLMWQASPLIAVLLTIWFSLSYAMRWLNHRHHHRTGRRLAVLSTLLGWTLLSAIMLSVLVFAIIFRGLPALPIIVTLLLAGLMRHWLERFVPPKWRWLRGKRGMGVPQIDVRFF